MFIFEFIILFSFFTSVIFCLFFIKNILNYPSGNLEMIRISKLIESCAKIYLQIQYKKIFFVSIILSIIIFIFFDKYYTIGFILGALFSGSVGYIGMLISVKANVRTANAARIENLSKALKIAFRSGGVVGLLVISLSFFSVFLFYKFLLTINFDLKSTLNILIALCFGSSLISVFARLGGGIFTKSADIGADLVGKLELGIPEDDIRNPAVIADNVGDNVGDCAGMAADLYETCNITIISSMFFLYNLDNHIFNNNIILYPIILFSLSIFSTILALLFIKVFKNDVMLTLYVSFFISVFILIFLCFIFIFFNIGWNKIFIFSSIKLFGRDFFYCSLIGYFLTIFLFFITEYYTSYKYYPVKDIAKVSSNGHAANIIQGFALAMESTVLPVILVVISILLSYKIANILGIALSVVSMVSLSGIIIALDAYGPITDNAGGIAVMAKLDENVRKKTDILDSVGNTTKAITKGYAIGSAGLGSLVLFILYTEDLNFYFPGINLNFSLKDPFVISGLFFGGVIPYIFSSFTMRSVGHVASKIIDNIREQCSNLKNSNIEPNYFKIINILTIESVKAMIIPSILSVFLPIIYFSFVLFFFGKSNAFLTLGSMLLGTIIIGIFLAISMTSGGGAWDNAKKYIETGFNGGKNSFAHKASITGDTVGDPFKDTVGPAINPLIKVINIVSLLVIIFVSKI